MTTDRPVTEDELNAALAGPLAHPMPMFTISRLVLCLQAVLQASGPAGAAAFRAYCQQRQERDEIGDDCDYGHEGEDS